MQEKTIHQGRNVKRFREMLGIKQDALADALGEDWNQKKISLLEARETINSDTLELVAKVLNVPVKAIENFDEKGAVTYFNTFTDNSSNQGNIGEHSTYNFNPVEKWLEALEENKKLYAGIEACKEDDNKGPDAIVKVLDKEPITVQITRFTLTEYLKRRKVAEKQVENLIKKILAISKVTTPVNIMLNTFPVDGFPFKFEKTQDNLSKLIAKCIADHQKELSTSNKFINVPIEDEYIKSFAPLLTLQGIPEGFYSNFYGRDNIFIDLDFDNVRFSQKDVEDECLNIFKKKQGGKAKILLIWADTFEILYDPKEIIQALKKQFIDTTFKNVIFFNFYNTIYQYLESEVGIAQIK